MQRTVERAAWVAPRMWTVSGVWIWALPVLFIGIWTGLQTRLGWGRGALEAVGTGLVLLLARFLGISLYNHFYARAWPFTWIMADGQLTRVPISANAVPLTALAGPFGVLVGLMADVWGWTIIIPERWTVFPLALCLVAWGWAVATLILYNHVVARWWGGLSIQPDASTPRLGHLAERPLFRSVAMVAYAWVIVAIVVIWGVAAVLMMILAGQFPAGAFGMEVGLFAAALTAFLGYWMALVWGLWYALGARLYHRWQRRHGPVRWGRRLDEVTF